MASRKSSGIYSGFARRLDVLSPQEQMRFKMARKATQNPFSIGDRVQTLDAYGKPLKTGFVKDFAQAHYGAWCIHIVLDEAPDALGVAYYPRGVSFVGITFQQARIRSILRKAHPRIIAMPVSVGQVEKDAA